MNAARKLLSQVSQKLELPADVTVGVPRMELIGREEFHIEPQKGLLEYSDQKISVKTAIGVVSVLGSNMEIKTMNEQRLCLIGKISKVLLGGEIE